MAPAMRTSGSNACCPSTSGATPRVMPRASTTSTTGSPTMRATAALESRPSSDMPSCSPLLPSTMHASAPRE
jgi:hypothetical protein